MLLARTSQGAGCMHSTDSAEFHRRRQPQSGDPRALTALRRGVLNFGVMFFSPKPPTAIGVPRYLPLRRLCAMGGPDRFGLLA